MRACLTRQTSANPRFRVRAKNDVLRFSGPNEDETERTVVVVPVAFHSRVRDGIPGARSPDVRIGSGFGFHYLRGVRLRSSDSSIIFRDPAAGTQCDKPKKLAASEKRLPPGATTAEDYKWDGSNGLELRMNGGRSSSPDTDPENCFGNAARLSLFSSGAKLFCGLCALTQGDHILLAGRFFGRRLLFAASPMRLARRCPKCQSSGASRASWRGISLGPYGDRCRLAGRIFHRRGRAGRWIPGWSKPGPSASPARG